MKIINIQLPCPCNRQPQHADDWDDNDTIGVNLKRRGKDFYELWLDENFGVFLGIKNKVMIGIKDTDYNMKDIKYYDTLEQAKLEWILD